MSYQRITRDEYNIMAMYDGYNGYELVSCAETRREAIQLKRDYLANDRGLVDIKIVKKRVRI